MYIYSSNNLSPRIKDSGIGSTQPNSCIEKMVEHVLVSEVSYCVDRLIVMHNSSTTQVCSCYLVTFLNRTVNLLGVWLGEDQRTNTINTTRCLKEIGVLRPQILSSTPHSIGNITIGRTQLFSYKITKHALPLTTAKYIKGGPTFDPIFADTSSQIFWCNTSFVVWI